LRHIGRCPRFADYVNQTYAPWLSTSGKKPATVSSEWYTSAAVVLLDCGEPAPGQNQDLESVQKLLPILAGAPPGPMRGACLPRRRRQTRQGVNPLRYSTDRATKQMARRRLEGAWRPALDRADRLLLIRHGGSVPDQEKPFKMNLISMFCDRDGLRDALRACGGPHSVANRSGVSFRR